MSFQAVAGSGHAVRLLQSGIRSGKVSHAYIFHGPVGSGKLATATAFAGALLCERKSDDSCGVCVQCRKLASGNHTGLHYITPDGASVKIEQIRELQRQFSYRSSADAAIQLYIVSDADKMTVQAANSLLKFLEEPHTPIVAILLATNVHALLPTIRSRAQWVPFIPAAPGEMAPVLLQEGRSAPLVQAAVHLAAGPDAARQLIEANWFAEIRNVVIQLAKECSGDAASALATAQRQIVKSELADHVDTLFDLFVLWFKDMVHLQWNRK